MSIKKRVLLLIWPLVRVLKWISKSLYLITLRYKFKMEWGYTPNPEWFDHEFDMAFFPEWKRVHFFERGVYLQEMLSPNDIVLDLCCGEGSVTSLFIAPKVNKVFAVDFSDESIKLANRKFLSSQKNIKFVRGDVRSLSSVFTTSFSVVTWDAGIEHFTKEEMKKIIDSVKLVLATDGIFIGSTIVRQESGLMHHDHEYEFVSTEDLRDFLCIFFKNVFVFQRKHEDRTSMYFRCSNDLAVDLTSHHR